MAGIATLQNTGDRMLSRTCETCGTAFSVRAAYVKQRAGAGRFCSVRCRCDIGRVTNTCLTCKAPFSVYRCLSEKRLYCSLACARRVEMSRITCEKCGRQSEPLTPSQAKRRRFCSVPCANEAARKRHADVAVRYTGTAWRAAKRAALDRDDHRCTTCGSKWLLHVHHIVPWAQTQDDSLGNLLTLCQVCHARLHYGDGTAARMREARWA